MPINQTTIKQNRGKRSTFVPSVLVFAFVFVAQRFVFVAKRFVFVAQRFVFVAQCFVFTLIAIITSCTPDDAPQSLVPEVSILPADSITRTSARLHGTVIQRGTAPIDTLYFLYSPNNNLTAALSCADAPGASANVSTTITSLLPATTYYYCLYAGNSHSIISSDIASFTTLPNARPTLTTPILLSQGPLSIICSYNITDDGGSSIIETGCYLQSASMPKTKFLSSGSASRLRITPLLPNTTYSLSAYAVNAEGETETEPLTFTTSDAVVLAEPGQLADVLDAEGMEYYAGHGRRISIAGSMNGDDVYVLRSLLGECSDASAAWDVNLADAGIVTGGRAYGYGRYTEDDVIGYGMFGGCAVRSVVLPDNVVTVQHNAFIDCHNLNSIVLSASVADIEPSEGCAALQSISVSKANSRFTAIDGVLFNADASSLVWFPLGKTGDYTLPKTVTSIANYAFRGCSISSFSLPEGITQIGQGAFADSRVQNVTLPSTLRTVPSATFQNCQQLTSVRLGTATELISDYAFDGCPLTAIYLGATIPPVCSSKAFIKYDATLYVPSASVPVYKAHKIWSKFKISPLQ